MGRPLPEIECKIVDPETGEELPDNVTGEFVARGYNIMKGYYKMPEATAAAIDEDGWLHTGDLARRDENGNYYLDAYQESPSDSPDKAGYKSDYQQLISYKYRK